MVSFLEIGTQPILHKETILNAPETNKIATCPGKKLQHLFTFASRDSFLFSSSILYSSFCYIFVWKSE